MRRIINSLSNTDLIKVVIAISALLSFVMFLIMKFFIGYGGLIETIYWVMLFIFLFFTSALIFFDKEEAKDIWIMVGLGFLASFWNKKGQKNEEKNFKDGDLVDRTIFKYGYFTSNLKSEKKYKDGKCISGDC